MTWPDIINDL